MTKRPPIPTELERLILLESGHRCAIPACRQIPVEIAHIISWSRCKSHEFPNLIALCPTCHTRYDNGQIDRKSMFVYKRNAWLHSSRYSDLEKRVLLLLARVKSNETWLWGGFGLLLSELIADGILIDSGQARPDDLPATLQERLYKLTPAGERLVESLQNLEPPIAERSSHERKNGGT